MITKTELVDYFLAMSGQYLIPDFLKVNQITDKTLNAIIKSALTTYSELNPNVKTKVLGLYNGKVFDGKDGEDIPDLIISIKSNVGNGISFNWFGYNHLGDGLISPNHYKLMPDKSLKFALPQDFYTVQYTVPHVYDTEKESIESISNDNLFMDLFSALMMIAVGRSRRAFAMNDMPFTVDADSMISEGTELKNEVIEKLKERSKYILGW